MIHYIIFDVPGTNRKRCLSPKFKADSFCDFPQERSIPRFAASTQIDDLETIDVALWHDSGGAGCGRDRCPCRPVGRDPLGGEHMMSAPVIMLENLTVTYDRHPALHHVCGCFEPGSLTAIVGPNGAGKSTLLKTIMGLLDPAEGCVRCDSVDRRRDFAYLPQQAEIDRSFPINVVDTVAAGAWRDIGVFGGVMPATRRLIGEALSAVGLAGFERRSIGSLSAGQFQRVLFARVLMQAAPIILLDEPFTAIDARTTADLLALVQRWHGEAKTIVAVLHDIEQVRQYFPHTFLLAREPIGWGVTEEVLTPANLLVMRRMSEAWDEDAEFCARRAS